MSRSLTAVAALMLSACAGIGPHGVAPLPHDTPRRWPHSWEDVFATPTPLDVRAYQTGYVLTGPRILIDADDPATPAASKKEQWVPVLSYLVEHPREGRFLLDTGAPLANAAGRCDFGIPPFFHAPCVSSIAANVVAQLRGEGIGVASLRFALVSHLHGDHAGGIAALEHQAPLRVVVAPEEWAAAARTGRMLDGYIVGQLGVPFDVATLPMNDAVEMPLLGRVLDLFGDGSVWVIPTTGHTRGEISVLLNAVSGPLLLTFDAVHLRDGLTHQVSPGFTVDHDAAAASVRRLAAFSSAYPRVRVVFGHEPSQWRGLPRAVWLSHDSASRATTADAADGRRSDARAAPPNP